MIAVRAMSDFKSDQLEFRRQTTRRLLCESLLLAVLLASVLLEFAPMIPKWIQWAVVIACCAYILAGWAFYPRAKAIANSFRVSLHDDHLSFSHAHGGGEVRYADLRMAKVKRRHGELAEIILVAKSGQAIRLRGLENMAELHRSLSARIAA
jgi:hypothetical protein